MLVADLKGGAVLMQHHPDFLEIQFANLVEGKLLQKFDKLLLDILFGVVILNPGLEHAFALLRIDIPPLVDFIVRVHVFVIASPSTQFSFLIIILIVVVYIFVLVVDPVSAVQFLLSLSFGLRV